MDIILIRQLIFGAIGSAGFGLIYRLPARYIPSVSIGGMLGWIVYTAVNRAGGSMFMQAIAAGFATAVYAEILARCYRAPSTLFFAVSVIPLVPGKPLYECMNAMAEGNRILAMSKGTETLLFAAGIAGGMGLAWSICDFMRKLRRIARI